MKKLVIFGAADQAEIAAYLFKNDSNHQTVAFTVDDSYAKDDSFNGLPLIPFSNIDKVFSPSSHEMFIAMGYNQMNEARARKCKEAKDKGYKLASYVSSKAVTWPDFACGENCLILELNNIQPFVKIGHNITLWSGNHIGHHAVIGDNTFLTSHVVVSGRVTIGRNSFLGVNTTLRDKITIGEYCLIAAGAVVTGDTETYGVYVGNPARRLKKDSREVTI